MARTQAVYYRDKHGAEPVNEFIEALPPRRPAKIDDYVEEYLNDRPASAPPPEFPVSSQIHGELRELRVRSRTRGTACCISGRRILWSFCMRSRRTRVRSASRTSGWRSRGWLTSSGGWMRDRGCRRGRRVKMRRPAAEEAVDLFIKIDKLGSR